MPDPSFPGRPTLPIDVVVVVVAVVAAAVVTAVIVVPSTTVTAAVGTIAIVPFGTMLADAATREAGIREDGTQGVDLMVIFAIVIVRIVPVLVEVGPPSAAITVSPPPSTAADDAVHRSLQLQSERVATLLAQAPI